MATVTQSSSRLTVEMLRMFAGLLIWAAHFGVIYGVTALVCARRLADVAILGLGLVPFTIAIATLIALLAAGLVLALAVGDLRAARHAPERDQTRVFLSYMTATVAGLAIVAIAWDALPALIVVPACA
jgi:uncharacterized protein involved in cysteine biosynthesis